LAYDQIEEPQDELHPDWNRDIYLTYTQNGETFHFVHSPWDDYAPAYSPDGEKLAFISNRSGKAEIWVKGTQNRELVQLTGSLQYPLNPVSNKLSWTKDGRYILYTYEKEAGISGLARVRVL